MKFPAAQTLRLLFLATALLVAQWVLVQHEVEIDAHNAHAACEWCLTHAPLTGGLAATPPPMPAIAMPDGAIAGRGSSLFTAILLPAFSARAPPAVLPA